MPNKTVCRFVSALVASVIATLAGEQAYAEDYLGRAKSELAANRYDDAIRLLREERRKAEKNKAVAPIDNLIGWSYFSSGNVADAERFLKSALAMADQENNSEVKTLAANNLGIVYFVKGDLDKSLRFFNQPYTKQSSIAVQYRQLIQSKRTAIEVERYAQEGIAHRGKLEFARAVESYDKALDQSPDDPRLLELKGYALFRLKKYEDAIHILETGMRVDSAGTRPFIQLNLLKSYCAANRDRDIALLIERAALSRSALQLWWENDRELNDACRGNRAVRQVLNEKSPEKSLIAIDDRAPNTAKP